VSFSYDPTLADAVSRIRFRLGDTSESDPPRLLEDEEISAVLVTEGSAELHAAEKLCQAILSKIARDVNTSGAGLNTTREQKTTHYKDVLSEIRAELSTQGQPIFTGNSKENFDAVRDDDDTRYVLTQLRRDRGCW